MDTKATGRYEVRLLDDLQKVFCREELSAKPMAVSRGMDQSGVKRTLTTA